MTMTLLIRQRAEMPLTLTRENRQISYWACTKLVRKTAGGGKHLERRKSPCGL